MLSHYSESSRGLLYPTDPERFGNARIMERQGLGTFLLQSVRDADFHSARLRWWADAVSNLEPHAVHDSVQELMALTHHVGLNGYRCQPRAPGAFSSAAS